MGNSTNLSDKVEIITDKYLKMSEAFAKMTSIALSDELKKMTAIHQDFLGASCILNNDEKNPISYYQETAESSPEVLNTLINRDLKLLITFPIGFLQLTRSNIPPLNNHFVLNIKKENFSCAIHLSLDSLSDLSRNIDQLESLIVNSDGKLFYNISKKSKNDERDQNYYAKNIKSNSGVFKHDREDGTKIIAYAKVPSFDLYALTEIPEEKAFQASEQLIKKSIYFGIALLSFALMVGVLFSNSLTEALTYLSNAANSIAEGNFSTPIDQSKATNDEVGSLNYTFENMRKKIVAYMEEMKEKYRLENEVKVAQIVQSSFFPQTSFKLSDTNLFGSYAPASECGGDWWGYLVQENKVSVVICDATGHGVPAALLTAAAHSTVSNLNIESKNRYISPSEILTRINQVVSLMNSSVQLTGFVFELNTKNGEYRYANASHQPALIFSMDPEGSYTKSEIQPLQENTGARLGESFNSLYNESIGKLRNNDFIFLYTDGILEFEKEGKAFGQRNFLKYILESLNTKNNSAESVTESFMANFNNFRDNAPLQDDITFLTIAYNNLNQNSFLEINNLNDIENIKPEDKIIVSNLTNLENVEKILLRRKVNHLIGANSLSREVELEAISQISKGKTRIGKQIFQSFLERNDQITFVTKNLLDEIEKHGITKINIPNITFAVEELLSNAFYHSDKNPTNTRGIVINNSEQPIEISVDVDEKYLAVYVEASTPNPGIESLLNSIRRGQVEKLPVLENGGAGLGLYLIYEKAHQFWIIEKNNKLGFRIVFERFNRNLQAQERITSFHYIKLA